MEALLHQSKAMCPFLKKTSPGTLRSLSTATHHSPGGGTITNLQFIARRCPVMNKALAIQSARMQTPKYSAAAPSARVIQTMLAKKLHTSAEKKAHIDSRIYRKRDAGTPIISRSMSFWGQLTDTAFSSAGSIQQRLHRLQRHVQCRTQTGTETVRPISRKI